MAEEQVVDTGTPEPAAPPTPMNERPADGPGSGRSALRKELEKSVDSARRAQEPEPKPRAKGKYVSSARREEVQGAESAPAEGEVEAAPAEEAAAEPQVAAPEGWTKEAKAEWENLPPAVQAAVSKRETDMAKGVEQIQKKYAEIDGVLQPRMELIRRHGHSPAQAVNQLFAWFESLSANPQVAFPALAESFKYNLRSIPGLIPQELIQLWQEKQKAGTAPQPGQPAAEAQPAGEIPPGVQKYIDEMRQEISALKQGFTNEIGQLSTSFQQQSQAKTEEILANWSRDKPHFEEVRRTMSRLIASQEVPPLPNGAADLDRAYDMALWALPEIREKILAEQRQKADAELKAKQAAERKAQQDQANNARRAQGGSLTAGAPGAPSLPVKGKKGKSVSESLREAINELRE